MKECIKCLMAALVAIIGLSANAAWTFYPAEEAFLPDGKTKFVGTVTDGVVTFHVTQNKNNQLTINAQYGYFNDPDAIPGGGSFRLISARFTTPQKQRGITQLTLDIFPSTVINLVPIIY